ncbi:type II toxin-antitoxin system ParD family antitoxin [Pseudomonas sp. B21-054]|uniref:ribbon-helix-helix domain-containing protein n=1 Tax=Pseudomonas sp. B21-054 TaxID=2895494 RepID=UPI00222EA2BC|nr:type II toxin-antitoxin system ParD family antitoxin [Pseudomonas sp. B21-054]UZE17605.1 type II toxin-antitoxin system ParD family antitoxin [Pseudomonas sp. B21-054]
MHSTQQLSITLPNQLTERVKANVAAGECATESEVTREALQALRGRDNALKNWLVSQVAPAYDVLKADPARTLSVDQVRSRLSAEHRDRTHG